MFDIFTITNIIDIIL